MTKTFRMSFAISICVVVLITLVTFFRDFRKSDQSPVIFLLGLTLLIMLCSFSGITASPFINGPASLLFIGGALLILFGGARVKEK